MNRHSEPTPTPDVGLDAIRERASWLDEHHASYRDDIRALVARIEQAEAEVEESDREATRMIDALQRRTRECDEALAARDDVAAQLVHASRRADDAERKVAAVEALARDLERLGPEQGGYAHEYATFIRAAVAGPEADQ
ncbi:hypothetical protein [Aeromicrobium sp. CTD01-1L150]|uniref:hypothetical protein n=1 Tax=Aeromicrobium sp. CTD01-1L150 TaxID=3341830 RepID=UPI0035BF3369